MELHANARLTPFGRTLMCERVREQGWSVREAAVAAGCSERTCYRWLARFDAGEAMADRSSAPRTVPGRRAQREFGESEAQKDLTWSGRGRTSASCPARCQVSHTSPAHASPPQQSQHSPSAASGLL